LGGADVPLVPLKLVGAAPGADADPAKAAVVLAPEEGADRGLDADDGLVALALVGVLLELADEGGLIPMRARAAAACAAVASLVEMVGGADRWVVVMAGRLLVLPDGTLPTEGRLPALIEKLPGDAAPRGEGVPDTVGEGNCGLLALFGEDAAPGVASPDMFWRPAKGSAGT
jgi:hypothetical protein